MLDNTITLSVDDANDGNPADEDWTRDEEHLNKTVYTGPGHSLVSRLLLTLNRVRPKRNGNFNGVARSGVKFTQDVEVDGVDTTTSIVQPFLGEISFSTPVGVTAAQKMLMRQRMIAWLDDDTTADAAMDGSI